MPAYIPITDAQTDPDAPLTSELAKQWRDNPIAIIEGATGAPRILLSARERLIVGDSIRLETLGSVASGTGSFGAVVSIFEPVQAGTFRLKFGHNRGVGGTVLTEVRRTRAKVTTTEGSFTASTSTDTLVTADLPCQPGDVFAIRTRNSGGGGAAAVNNLTVCVDSATYLWPTPTYMGLILNNPTIV
jgi:hypothetical protein